MGMMQVSLLMPIACLACCTQGTLRQRLDRTAGSAMEEKLLKDPLRFHKTTLI